MLDRNLFKGAIASAGYTQTRLAREVKMSNKTLSSRVTGKTSFSVDEIDEIGCVLNLSSNDKAKIFLSSISQ